MIVSQQKYYSVIPHPARADENVNMLKYGFFFFSLTIMATGRQTDSLAGMVNIKSKMYARHK